MASKKIISISWTFCIFLWNKLNHFIACIWFKTLFRSLCAVLLIFYWEYFLLVFFRFVVICCVCLYFFMYYVIINICLAYLTWAIELSFIFLLFFYWINPHFLCYKFCIDFLFLLITELFITSYARTKRKRKIEKKKQSPYIARIIDWISNSRT